MAYDAGKYPTLGGYADDLIDITGELGLLGPSSSATRSAPSAGGNSLLDTSARAMMRARGVLESTIAEATFRAVRAPIDLVRP